ncbi:MAG TPA: vWA domain-containing protein [Patescibacteria group bacterium]|nr:vWA domain-containing protein [Patescibacteria group bacterium]
MAYNAEISRANPSCFVFLIDQSGSMADARGGGASSRNKAQGLSDILNNLLRNLILRCAKEEGVRDYYQIGVLGYGQTVGPALGGSLAGRQLVPLSEIATSPVRLDEREKEDGVGGLVKIKFPIWVDPIANGGTPMCQAFAQAQTILEGWLTQHASSFPPIVINITDGEATDGDPSSAADSLRRLSTNDGEVLVFNIHLSSHHATPIEFPNSEAGLPDQFAQLLFRMSSHLPPHMCAAAQQEGYRLQEGARGFVFNADMVAVIKALEIGTRPSNLR